MMEDTALQVGSQLHWAPLLAAVACAAGIALLLLATWRAEREQRAQTERIRTLEGQLADALHGQLDLQRVVGELREQGSALRLRQERIEKRAPDGRRIDQAVRLVQNGHGQADMLRDLGLSRGEAELLLRLHRGTQRPATAPQVAAPTTAASSQADGLARALAATAAG